MDQPSDPPSTSNAAPASDSPPDDPSPPPASSSKKKKAAKSIDINSMEMFPALGSSQPAARAPRPPAATTWQVKPSVPLRGSAIRQAQPPSNLTTDIFDLPASEQPRTIRRADGTAPRAGSSNQTAETVKQVIARTKTQIDVSVKP